MKKFLVNAATKHPLTTLFTLHILDLALFALIISFVFNLFV
jgi:hypothetical protein